MKKTGTLQFISGFLLGALVLGGGMSIASGTVAQPKTAGVVVDGRDADLAGYLIDGAHYFQLRGLAEQLIPGGKDFSVVWDGENNRIIIDTSKGYDPDE